MMRYPSIIFALSLSLLSGCNQDTNTSNTNTNTAKPDATALTDAYDREMISQIHRASDILSKESIWLNYGQWFKSTPIYMLRMNDHSNKDPIKAFIFNPKQVSNDLQALGKNEASGLHVFRIDTNLHVVNDKLNTGNGMFEFYYDVQGTTYYVQKYHKLEMSPNHTEYGSKTIDRNISLNVHENFHKYQSQHFKYPTSYVQDLKNYPVNADLIELKLLTLQTLKGLPAKLSKEEVKKRLKHYVALTQEQINIDPSAKRLVTNMGLWQELAEGSARYVEVMMTRHMFTHTAHSTFVYDWFLDIEYKSKKQVYDEFSFNIFYQSGAAVIWLLKESGYDLKKLESGISPYHAAVEHLGEGIDYKLELLEVFATTKNAEKIKAKAHQLARF